MGSFLHYCLAALIGALLMHTYTYLSSENNFFRSISENSLSSSSNPDASLEAAIIAEMDKPKEMTFQESLPVGEISWGSTTELKKTVDGSFPQRNTRPVIGRRMRLRPGGLRGREDNLPVLPSKLFTIVGLESSGTTFVSKTIGQALQLPRLLKGDGSETVAFGQSSTFEDGSKRPVEVQHISIPWGQNCMKYPKAHIENIVPVVYPRVCTLHMRMKARRSQAQTQNSLAQVRLERMRRGTSIFSQSKIQQCDALVQGEQIAMPPRYFLNITSHFEWYRNHGVDAYIIVVIRDKSVSSAARVNHCEIPDLLAAEEQVGMNIINEAMKQYISVPIMRRRRRLLSTADSPSGGIITSKDSRFIIISYELLNRFKFNYLKLLYNHLGIVSDFNPEWKDGNIKYIGGLKSTQSGTESAGPKQQNSRTSNNLAARLAVGLGNYYKRKKRLTPA